MSEVERLLEWFGSGRLVRPSADELNFVDLVRALAKLGGVEGLGRGPGVDALGRTIGTGEQCVFILVDGLGADLLGRLPADAFMRTHLAAELQSVFLSTTSAALTTLATGLWPCAHGVPGWWTCLKGRDISTIPLLFQERTTGQSLSKWGVSAEELFPVPSFWGGFREEPLSVVPKKLQKSTYSRYLRGGTACAGYKGLGDAFAIARERVLGEAGPGFTYVYVSEVDSLEHKRGTDDGQVHALVREVDGRVAELAGALKGRARLVVSSDHGQVNVPEGRRFVLPGDDPLRGDLLCRPTGEPEVPIFHVRSGREEGFRAGFLARFGEFFALLTVAEVEELRLLGPGDLSGVMRERMGTYVGISREPVKLYFEPVRGNNVQHVGVHGGLSRGEMTVPLVVA